MKCTKCGFNSFEYYDSCIKCSNDLTAYKQTYSISPLILPQEAKVKLAAQFKSLESDSDESIAPAETHDDIFAFDLPEGSPAAQASRNDDPFNFDEPSSDGADSGSDDVFANLLESTSQVETTPAGGVQAAAGGGEMELDSFSWDDNSSVTNANKDLDDSLDSLFGEPADNSKK